MTSRAYWQKGVKTMKMFRVIAFLSASLLGSTAFAQSCTSSQNLGNMGPPDLAMFGNSFSAAGAYTDCYTFNLSGSAGSFGGAIQLDSLLNKLDISLNSISLFSGGTQLAIDTSPLAFSFGALAGGVSYTLAVASSVTGTWGLTDKPVAYLGAFTTYAAPVPEPSSLAMVIMGLLAVGAAVRRKFN